MEEKNKTDRHGLVYVNFFKEKKKRKKSWTMMEAVWSFARVHIKKPNHPTSSSNHQKTKEKTETENARNAYNDVAKIRARSHFVKNTKYELAVTTRHV